MSDTTTLTPNTDLFRDPTAASGSASGEASPTKKNPQPLGLNARQVISKRYSLKDEEGHPIEEWPMIVKRVVSHISKAETDPDWRRQFFDALSKIMLRREFLPNTPCLVNAGKPDGMLAACFVLPVPDSIKGIMEHAKACAIVHQQGGGTGMTYEFLRPAGALVGSTRGEASGPVSFMNIVNQMTEVVKQGGVRRGANMSMLRVSHPDVLRFIHAKNDQHSFQNFNISVTLTDDFLRAADAGRWFQLEFAGQPWTKPIYDPVSEDDYAIYVPKEDYPLTADSKLPQPVTFRDRAAFLATDLTKYEKVMPSQPGLIYAPDVWNRIVASAHKYGEPGIAFIDEVNRHNLLMKSMGPIYSSNPCVTGDTRAYTDDGLIPMLELYETQRHFDAVVDARFGHQPTLAPSSTAFKTGYKEVFRLQTKEGYYIRATADHKIMTPRGWVELNQLQPGDQIHILNRKGGFGVKGSLDEGRVLGWLIGDGHFNESMKTAILSFFGEDRNLAEAFAGSANRLVGENSRYQMGVVKISNRDESRVGSERLYQHLVSQGLTAANKLSVPERVLRGSENMQRGFLQGLFSADGTVLDGGEHGTQVRLASVSLRLLEEVQQLLLNFKIASSIYRNRRKAAEMPLPDGHGGRKNYACQALHELAIRKTNLTTFSKEIGLLQETKNQKLRSCLTRMVRGPYAEHFTATVKEIISEGIEEVYDITVPGPHSFIANGIVISNCSEQMLHFNNSCNLGSIDLAKFYTAEKGLDWDRLKETVHWAVRFLDNVIDVCAWPLPEIEETVKRTRPVGLGVMGFADLCLLMEITYGSDESIKLMEDVLGFIRREGWIASCHLGREKGVFPELAANYTAYRDLLLKLKVIDATSNGHDHVTPRNYQVTNVAPTGTISLAAETSSGIEPNFEFAFIRQDTVGTRKYVHPLAALALGIEVDQTSLSAIDHGAASVMEQRAKLPPHFVTAMEIDAEKHVLILAAAQRNVDNAVSKTVNGAADDTVESVDALYRLARQLSCKAVSYYRDGSRENQVLTTIKKTVKQPTAPITNTETQSPPPVIVESLTERAPDRRDRPRELQGATWQIEFEGHNLYVTVNHDEREILEVFVTGPISSSVGKLASKMLRGGFHAREVAQTLNTTTGTHAVWFNQRCVTSPEQAIAECIYIMSQRLSPSPQSQAGATGIKTNANSPAAASEHSLNLSQTPLCPHCGVKLVRTGSCWLCTPCAYSKCS